MGGGFSGDFLPFPNGPRCDLRGTRSAVRAERIDTAVPIAGLLWWLNLATLLGWVLSSIFVLSLTRLSRST
jgi:hypothetical protein